MPQIVSQSNDPEHDALLGRTGLCGHAHTGAYQDGCGQTSIIRFIEDNWGLGRIGNQSFDAKAGSLMNMFDFAALGHHADKLLLNPSSGTYDQPSLKKIIRPRINLTFRTTVC
jgi:phospholipase C